MADMRTPRLKDVMVVCLAVLCCSHSGQTTRQCTDGTVVGMTSPALMRGGRDIRPSYGRGYVMTNPAYVIPCCGVLQQWTFHMARAALANPVSFHVWRPANHRAGDKRNYTLVGKNDAYADRRTVYYRHGGDSEDESDEDDDDDGGDGDESSGAVSVPVRLSEQISVWEGDVIGWLSPRGDVISYTTHYYNLDNIVVNRMEEVEVGETYDLPPPLPYHRTYGMHALLSAGSPPVLTNLPASVHMHGDVTAGTVVFNVTGYDANSGDVMTFSLWEDEAGDTDAADESPFVIEPLSGVIQTKERLLHSSYDVKIMMADSCELNDVRSLTVIVSSSNSPPTMQLPPTLSVAVNDGNADFSYQIDVTDDDGDDVTCCVSDVDPLMSWISTSGTSLLVRLQGNVTSEPEINMTYAVNVTCGDGVYNVTSRVKLHFFDHKPPAFLASLVTVPVAARASRAGDVIYQLEATSPKQLPLVFRVENFDGPFYLHPDGSIAVKRSLMSEEVTSYSLEAYVTDSVVTVGPAKVFLMITDVNHAPRLMNAPHLLMVEENTAGDVLHLHVHDPDNDFPSVSLSWIPRKAATFFSFDETRGAIGVRPSSHVDFEHLHRLELTQITSVVTASDGFKAASANVTIIVSDVNEAPVWSQSSFDVICDDRKTGTVLVTDLHHLVTDPDLHDSLTFTLTNASLPVTIHPLTGAISLASDYDVRADVKPITERLVVTAVDSGRLSSTALVKVIFVHNNQPPTITNLPWEITLPEDTASGAVVYRVTAEDADDDDVTIHMTVMEGGGRVFTFNKTDGRLTLTSQGLDYEATSTHVLLFAANDGTLTSLLVTLTVRVSDVNEAPYFTRDAFHISATEGMAGKHLGDGGVLSSTRDPDGDLLTFDLSPSPQASAFSIDTETAELFLASDFVITRQNSPTVIRLRLLVTDIGGLMASVSLIVTLRHVNVRPRLLDVPANISVPQSTKEGTLLYTLYAEDEDDDPLLFRLNTVSGRRQEEFRLHPTTGELSLTKRLPRASSPHTPYCRLQLSVTDGQLSSQPATLDIFVVEDKTDPAVTSQPYVISVREDELDYPIPLPHHLYAAESRLWESVTFHITAGSGQNLFHVDSASTTLRYDGDLDFDDPRVNCTLTLQITLESCAGKNRTKTAVIQVLDINDSAPEVTSDLVTWWVSKRSRIGSVIGRIEARDRDKGENGRLKYDIVSSTLSKERFRITGSGVVTVSQDLRAVTDTHVTLHVTVTDHGHPPLSTALAVFLIFT